MEDIMNEMKALVDGLDKDFQELKKKIKVKV